MFLGFALNSKEFNELELEVSALGLFDDEIDMPWGHVTYRRATETSEKMK